MSEEPESFARLAEGRRVLMLRHSEATLGCIFLTASGCGVHELRPDACRTYPYDRPENGEGLGLVPGAMCPLETGVLITLKKDGTSSQNEFLNAIQKRDEDLMQHAESIRRWNLRQRTRVRLGRTPQSGAEFLEDLLRNSSDAT